MAIYHLSVKTVGRSAGRSATAAAAYRSAVKITDDRTGEIHDYSRRGGVESVSIVLPKGAPAWANNRALLWNAAEQAETRKNATVAREFEIALPSELSVDEREQLAMEFARAIVERHGCAADVAIHSPGKKGDNRNHHAHILCTTRRLGPGGFNEKTRELDDRKTGLVDYWRQRFASMQNERLHAAGAESRVDHRTLEAQGIDREPTRHLGPTASGIEGRTGKASRKRTDFDRDAADRLAEAKLTGQLEREKLLLDRSIIELSLDIDAAKAQRQQSLLRKRNHERAHNGSRFDGGGRFDEYEGTKYDQFDAFADRSTGETEAINSLRDLSSWDVVPRGDRAQMLLPRDAVDKLADKRSNAPQAVRRIGIVMRSDPAIIDIRESMANEIMAARKDRRPADAVIEKVVQIAFTDADPVAAIGLDGFHLIYRYGLTAFQRNQVSDQFAGGSPLLIRTIGLLMTRGDTEAVKLALISPQNAAAYGYSLWSHRDMTEPGIEGVAQGARKKVDVLNFLETVFPRVRELLSLVCDWIHETSASPANFMANIVNIKETQGAVSGSAEISERLQIPNVDPAGAKAAGRESVRSRTNLPEFIEPLREDEYDDGIDYGQGQERGPAL